MNRDKLKYCFSTSQSKKNLIIFYSVGIIGHCIDFTRPVMFIMTPFVLFISYLFVLYPSFRNKNLRFFIWFLIGFLITFSVEVAGVKTGMLFGSYAYIENLGIKIFDVPLLIGLNWMMLLSGFIVLAEKIAPWKTISVLLSVLFITGFDFIMEPVAVYCKYWTWSGCDIPMQNYGMWALLSLVLVSFYHILKVNLRNPLIPFFAIVLVVYFSFLRLFVLFCG